MSLEEVRGRGQRWLDVTSELAPEPATADRVIQLEVTQRLASQVIMDFLSATEPKPKPHSPWTWPLVALGVIMVLAVGGTVLALVTSS